MIALACVFETVNKTHWGSFLKWESLFNRHDLTYSMWEIWTVHGWYWPNCPFGKSTGKRSTSKYFSLLSSGCSFTFSSLNWSMSDSVEIFPCMFTIVYDWKHRLWKLSQVFYWWHCLLPQLLVWQHCQQHHHLQTCTANWCLATCFPAFTTLTCTRLCHTILDFIDWLSTLTYNSGDDNSPGNVCVTPSSVSAVLVCGFGRKNIVPLHAFSEL